MLDELLLVLSCPVFGFVGTGAACEDELFDVPLLVDGLLVLEDEPPEDVPLLVDGLLVDVDGAEAPFAITGHENKPIQNKINTIGKTFFAILFILNPPWNVFNRNNFTFCD